MKKGKTTKSGMHRTVKSPVANSGKYGYIEIGSERIMITDGWKERLGELIRRTSLNKA